MYKLSVPIATQSLHDDTWQQDLATYISYFRRAGVERVFVCTLSPVYSLAFDQEIGAEKFSGTIDILQKQGFETGVWLGGFGHGCALAHDSGSVPRRPYRQMAGVLGDSFPHGYCPTDENFTADYMERVQKVAQMHPQLIMLDDDFRLNGRPYHLGCFCEAHLEEFYRLVGERPPRDKIEALMFTGGKNKYRDAYMQMSGQTKLAFARRVREAIDQVDPKIRAGICLPPSSLDLEGADPMALAHAIAGEGRPFLRPFGAPYHDDFELITALETQRLEVSWLRQADPCAELFAEGDLYPRPRYHVPSRTLELFDLVLRCNGKHDGCLAYIFDYTLHVGYEEGYLLRMLKNMPKVQEAVSLFAGKQPTGIPVYAHQHKLPDSLLPTPTERPMMGHVMAGRFGAFSVDMLSKNSIPTCYEPNGYPVAVFGENARHIPLSYLENGGILDAEAARILTGRGVDVGLVDIHRAEVCHGEYYPTTGNRFFFEAKDFYALTPVPGAHITSYLLPGQTPGAYTYENSEGKRFLVFAADFARTSFNKDYFNNYDRKNTLASDLAYVAGRPLPVSCPGHPQLYILASSGEDGLSVLLVNIFMDDVISPTLTLDRAYKGLCCVNCEGQLGGETLTLSDIPPFGFAAFRLTP